MKLVLASLFILITTGITVSCQDRYVDSLEKILTTKITDSIRGKIYIDLAEFIAEEDEWMKYNKKGLDLANKKLENWTLWIIADIITVPLYAYRGLGMLSLQYIIFTILAIQGYIEWKKTLNKNQQTV